MTSWQSLLATPFVRPLDYSLNMTLGDTFNYTQQLTSGVEGHHSVLMLYLLLRADRTRVLNQTGTVCIDNKYYFFDPTEGEDIKLYEYSLDPSVLE